VEGHAHERNQRFVRNRFEAFQSENGSFNFLTNWDSFVSKQKSGQSPG
jgi:hypothetical protein